MQKSVANFLTLRTPHIFQLRRRLWKNPVYYDAMFSKNRTVVNRTVCANYDGYLNCGRMTLIIFNELLKSGIVKESEIKVMQSSIGYGSDEENHVYLLITPHNQSPFCVDPTYKQFMRDERTSFPDYPYVSVDANKFVNNIYLKYVYERLPPFYVGDLSGIENVYTIAKKIHSIVYPSENLSLETASIFWSNSTDDTEYFRLYLGKVS